MLLALHNFYHITLLKAEACHKNCIIDNETVGTPLNLEFLSCYVVS